MKRLVFFFSVLVIFCFGATGFLSARSEEFIRKPDRGVEVEIIGDERGVLDFYWPDGRRSDYRCIEAERGERFSIQVRNNSSMQVGLVISIDGRNIISGKRSYSRNSESMYVVNPWQTSSFDGWRSSMDQVQRFYFTNKEDSYAGRLGDYSSIGWIKVAVFRPRHVNPPPLIYKEQDPGKTRSSRPGTGYGEGQNSQAQRVSFDPENFASQLIKIKYEWPNNKIHDSGFAAPPY
ncbi:MAG: hypothetical protein ACQETH_12815 [Candidatus Rifleibacteriota bacterium]